jgi:opacity protein-like surface antigen
MVGKRLTVSALAIAPLLVGASAQAADYNYNYPPPPPVYQPQPIIIQQPAVEFAGNWYLRGQVGYGITEASAMTFDANAATAAANFNINDSSVSDSFFIGAGVGYEWNSWLRFDVTGEFRGGMKLSALANYTNPSFALDKYEANLRSYLFLANAYVDLGTWDCFTPFVGVGVGTSYNMFRDFSDFGVPTGGRGFGRDTAQWDFAWALYAGITYNVSKNFKVDLSYRYLDYGSFSDTIDCVGGCGSGGPLTYHVDLRSHDFMLAFRWLCCELPAPPPKYYYPPPPPPPPPLHSKG